MDGELYVSAVVRDGTHTLAFRGDIDVATETDFFAHLDRAVEAAERGVQLDFREVGSLSAAGANRLALLANLAAEGRLEFRVVCASGPVRRTLHTYGLTALLC